MANATVEKVKALGLHHGEKVVMGLAAALSAMLLFMAATRPTIQTTPEEVAKAADQAAQNLDRPQSNEDILKRLEEAGITKPQFEKQVDNQAQNKLDALAYKVRGPWATPEPGAGLIREDPELIAPTELVAYPGRGGLLVYELKDGERIPITPEDAAAELGKLSATRKSRRSRMMSAGSGMPGMPGMGGAAMSPQQLARAKKQYEAEVKRKQSLLAGKDKATAEEKKEETTEAGPFKETTVGHRWVAITGVLDYKTLRENYQKALKKKEVAYPHFKRLGLQRQSLQSDGTWSDWEDVDHEANAKILNNLPEEDEEWAPDPVRLQNLVDPLPFLKAGYWERVHVASLVPKEKKKIEKFQAPNMAGMMPGMMPGSEGGSGMMTGGMMPEGMMYPEGMSGMGSGGYGMAGMMGGGAMDDMNFPKNEEETLMIRALDFTPEPDTTYRYKVQLVVYNPNYKRGDVAPGTRTEEDELKGPFSEPTEAVTVPADVAVYAMEKMPSVGQSDLVKFQVTRWDPSKGFMVVKNFDAGPGDVIGEYVSADIPSSEGEGVHSQRVDFNSHLVVLDVMGGTRPVPTEIDNSRFDVPALSLLVRPDGTVSVRNQVFDQTDEVRKQVEENYKREKDESKKARESSSTFMYGSS